jgi:hypothetical protein
VADDVGAEIRMAEPLGDAMDHRFFQGLVVEDRRIEEGRQQRIALGGLARLVAHRRPDRIDRLQLAATLHNNRVHPRSP